MLLKTVFPVPLNDIKAALLRDGEWSGEQHHHRRDGAEVVVSTHKVLRREADGQLSIMENVTDISQLQQAEAALREREAELRSIVDTAAEGIVVAHGDGRIASVNRAALRMFGYDAAEELIGRDLGAVMPTSEAGQHRTYLAAHQSGSPPRVIGVPGRELMAVRRDGSAFPIDLSVSAFGTNNHRCLTGIIRDATARKQAEAALERLAVMAEQVYDPVLLVARDGRILEANAAAAAAYGHDHAALLGLSIDDLRPPETQEIMAAQMAKADQGGVLFETLHRRADGSLFPVEVSSIGAEVSGQRVLVSVIRDITERKQAEAALRQRGPAAAGAGRGWDRLYRSETSWNHGHGFRHLCHALRPAAGNDIYY
jgi:PAS domain S-box-containing protein